MILNLRPCFPLTGEEPHNEKSISISHLAKIPTHLPCVTIAELSLLYERPSFSLVKSYPLMPSQACFSRPSQELFLLPLKKWSHVSKVFSPLQQKYFWKPQFTCKLLIHLFASFCSSATKKLSSFSVTQLSSSIPSYIFSWDFSQKVVLPWPHDHHKAGNGEHSVLISLEPLASFHAVDEWPFPET